MNSSEGRDKLALMGHGIRGREARGVEVRPVTRVYFHVISAWPELPIDKVEIASRNPTGYVAVQPRSSVNVYCQQYLACLLACL
jgi:hypothetical protein